MITVIGRWEDIWMDADRTERRIWKQTLQSYNVDEWMMTPPQGGVFTSPLQFTTIDEALKNTTNKGKRIFLTPEQTTQEFGLEAVSLTDYVHPEDAIYIFGGTTDNNIKTITDNDDIVTIYTPQKTDWFAVVALGAVLFDRFSKAS